MTLFPVVAMLCVMSSRRVNGQSVRSLREALGIRHGQFAVRVGVSAGYLTNIESGRKQPSPAIAKRISEELGVPLDAITYVVTTAVAS